jgi:hypothetical protein
MLLELYIIYHDYLCGSTVWALAVFWRLPAADEYPRCLSMVLLVQAVSDLRA